MTFWFLEDVFYWFRWSLFLWFDVKYNDYKMDRLKMCHTFYISSLGFILISGDPLTILIVLPSYLFDDIWIIFFPVVISLSKVDHANTSIQANTPVTQMFDISNASHLHIK